jgi:hypothetical protein
MRPTLRFLLVVAALFAAALPAGAQSPDTSTLVVVVEDPQGAVVPEAAVALTNSTTGVSRTAVADTRGAAALHALPLTGLYQVTVSKAGFADATTTGIALRAGETAMIRVKLTVAGGQSEVTVYGTTEACEPIRNSGSASTTWPSTRRRSWAASPHPAPPQLGLPPGQGHGRPLRQRDLLHHGRGARGARPRSPRRREQRRGWGRQTAICQPCPSAPSRRSGPHQRLRPRVRMDVRPRPQHRHQSGTNAVHGEALVLSRPGGDLQAKEFSTKGFCPESTPSCVTPGTLNAVSPVDIPDKLAQLSGSIGGPLVKDRTFFFLTSDYTWQDRTTFLSPTLPSFVLPPDGNLEWTGHYRQFLADARLDILHLRQQDAELRIAVEVATGQLLGGNSQ